MSAEGLTVAMKRPNEFPLELTRDDIDSFDPITRTAAKMMVKNGKARLVEG